MKYIIHNNIIYKWNIQDGKIEPLTAKQVCCILNTQELTKDRLRAKFDLIRKQLTR